MCGNQSSANGAVDTDGSSGFGGCAATSTSRLLLAASTTLPLAARSATPVSIGTPSMRVLSIPIASSCFAAVPLLLPPSPAFSPPASPALQPASSSPITSSPSQLADARGGASMAGYGALELLPLVHAAAYGAAPAVVAVVDGAATACVGRSASLSLPLARCRLWRGAGGCRHAGWCCACVARGHTYWRWWR